MITRAITPELMTLLQEYPVVTLLGPRQSGKTTLARMALPDFEYLNLETPDVHQHAQSDPRAFLNQHPPPVIFDEIQRAPDLRRYIQTLTDARPENGQYVLTDSHQLELRATITQSLAGHAALLHLLPFSVRELSAAGITLDGFEDYVIRGFLPRIYDQNQRPGAAYANYHQTYVERDVHQIIRLRDANLFNKFLRLLAGRVGQLIHYQSLAGDVGVDAKTIREWLSILEASFLVFPLPPYFENFGKRVIKSPKYYFTDVGLLAYLLGIETPAQVLRDPLMGQLFENLVILEALKARYNRGKPAELYFYRDSHGHEIDLLYPLGRELGGVEIKAASTFHSSFKKTLLYFSRRQHRLAQSHVIYNGAPMDFSDGVQALHFRDTSKLFS